MTRVYVGLGSNLGDREENLARARALLAQVPSTRVADFSSIYLTSPWGKLDQPEFLNQVVALETILTVREFFWEIQKIEQVMDRKRLKKWGPRNIDLDLLLFGNQVIDEPDLVVPHPWLTKRLFVMVPLLEIDRELELPGGQGLQELLEKNRTNYDLGCINKYIHAKMLKQHVLNGN